MISIEFRKILKLSEGLFYNFLIKLCLHDQCLGSLHFRGTAIYPDVGSFTVDQLTLKISQYKTSVPVCKITCVA